MPSIARISFKNVFGYFFLFVFCLLFVKIIDWGKALAVLETAPKGSLVLGTLLMIATFFIGILRYKLIIGDTLGPLETGYIYFLSKTGGSLTPARIGDFAPFLVRDYRKKEIGLAVVADKIVEFYLQLLFGFVGLLMLRNLPISLMALASTVFIAVSLAFSLLWNNPFWQKLSRWSSGQVQITHGRILFFLYHILDLLFSLAEKSSYEIRILGFRYVLVVMLSITSFGVLLLLTNILLVATSVHISLFLLMEIIALSGIIMIFSLVPLGLGITEVALLYILVRYGVNKDAFAAFALCSRTLTIATLFGCYCIMFMVMRFYRNKAVLFREKGIKTP
jgi:uncharacterized protein (TIRG00374 family)